MANKKKKNTICHEIDLMIYLNLPACGQAGSFLFRKPEAGPVSASAIADICCVQEISMYI